MSGARTKTGGGVKILFQKLARRMVLCMPQFMRDGLWLLYNSDSSVEFCLRRLKEKGFAPKNVVDCGAYLGDWTRMVKKNFPGANVLMIEPVSNQQRLLLQVKSEFPGTVDYVQCLVGPETKEAATFFEVDGGGPGSSVLGELTRFPHKPVTLPMRRLDDILAEKKIAGPLFLKLDVQGYELEVLKGAERAMQNAEVILLEVSFVRYNPSGPLFHEVVAFMSEHGFLVYEICPLGRWLGVTLFQADVFFVKEDSGFRQIDFAVGGRQDKPAAF